MTDAATSAALDTNVEGLLGFADDLPPDNRDAVTFLRDRVLLARRYAATWMRLANAADNVTLAAQIAGIEADLAKALALLPAGSLFPGKAATAHYDAASSRWAQTYRDVVFSGAWLPSMGLDDLITAAVNGPGDALTYAVEKVANALGRTLGATTAAIWSNLWPVLTIGGAVGLAYVFRAPLARALGKVAA